LIFSPESGLDLAQTPRNERQSACAQNLPGENGVHIPWLNSKRPKPTRQAFPPTICPGNRPCVQIWPSGNVCFHMERSAVSFQPSAEDELKQFCTLSPDGCALKAPCGDSSFRFFGHWSLFLEFRKASHRGRRAHGGKNDKRIFEFWVFSRSPNMSNTKKCFHKGVDWGKPRRGAGQGCAQQHRRDPAG